MNAVLLEALNAQLVAERDKALGREPYERGGQGANRNGFKDVRLPGLCGWLTVQRPVVRKGTLKLPLLDALGVDEDGRTHVLGFSVGDRESKDSWDGLLKDLIARGLAPKALRLVVSDAHKGIIAAVAERLNAPHQLCVVHKLRNVKCRVSRPDWKKFLAGGISAATRATNSTPVHSWYAGPPFVLLT